MGSSKKRRIETPLWLVIASVSLAALIVCEIVMFATSYTNLDRSIHQERIDSVQQISSLISEKLTFLKSSYENEVRASAAFFTHTDATSFEEAKWLVDDAEGLYLLTDDGRCLSLEGDAVVIESSILNEDLAAWTDVRSEFCTVQSKGDYWMFALPVQNVVLDGVVITGLLKLVDSQTYADVAVLPVFHGQGASYVVDKTGVVLMRPAQSQANEYFQGHNMIQQLTNEGVDKQSIDHLAQALKNNTEAQISVAIGGDTWLLQSFPDDEGRNIVMTIPVSVTAKTTFSGMENVIGAAILLVLTVAVLFVLWLHYLVVRSQKIKLQSVKVNMKSDFLTKMSHDIRTPLNAIVGMNELALRSLDDREAVAGYLHKTKKSSEYLISIITNMLDMSRIDSGKMQIAHKPFRMRELLDDVIALESGHADERGVSITEQLYPVSYDRFVGDAVRLKQCLVNLVSNAVKFTPEGGEVRLAYEELADEGSAVRVRLTVSDTGVGMSEEFMERLFEPFEQERSSLTSSHIGSGLGLSIVHNLAKLMGGTVEVESEQGAGTTFVLEFSFEKAQDEEEPSSEALCASPDASYRGKRILLAEDNAMNREIAIDLLSDLGIEVDVAENGLEAVELFEASQAGYYDLLLMDVQMPVMNGPEAVYAIRASDHPDSAEVPIVALSANAFEEDVQASLDSGMQDHLAKPIDLDDVRTMLYRYVGQTEQAKR